MDRIPVSGPWITQREIDYVTDAVTNAWFSNANVYHERFEKAFREAIGPRYAIALPSCTSAIHLSLTALGIGPGDEVVVPELTWIASAAPLSYVGATPIFADIDERTWCLSPKALEACITPRTKAVIPVDLYGNVADYEAIQQICRRHHIAIIEDAAQAVGAERQGRRAGSFGDTGVFSFHGSKMLTTGEGGMLVTDRQDLYERALYLRDHGRKPGDKSFYCSELAFKYKMSAMQAALGLGQVERLAELVARKREIFSWYREELADLPGITLNCEAPGTVSNFWMVSVVLSPEYALSKEELMPRMSALGIDTRPFFYPLSSLPAFSRASDVARARKANQVSYRLSERGINLPSGFNLDRALVARVCEGLRKVLAETRPIRKMA